MSSDAEIVSRGLRNKLEMAQGVCSCDDRTLFILFAGCEIFRNGRKCSVVVEWGIWHHNGHNRVYFERNQVEKRQICNIPLRINVRIYDLVSSNLVRQR